MAEKIKEEVATNEVKEETTTEKKPIDINISEKSQKGIVSFIKKLFEKYVSGNSTYKLLFFALLLVLVLLAAFLSYSGFITADTFKDILDIFLNLFSEPESTVESVSYLVDKVNFIG